MALEYLSQQPLGLTASQLRVKGKAPSQVEDLSIEKRNPGFQGGRHGRSIQFDQDVIGQVADEVEPEHVLGDPVSRDG